MGLCKKLSDSTKAIGQMIADTNAAATAAAEAQAPPLVIANPSSQAEVDRRR
jgi:hypothetical protein